VGRSWLGAEGDEAPTSAGEVRAAALEARGKVSSTTATTPPPARHHRHRRHARCQGRGGAGRWREEGRGRRRPGGTEREEGEREPIGSDKERGRPIG